MKIQPQDFAKMRDWFAFVSERTFPPSIMENAQPIAQLDQLAGRSPAKAREGLAMGIADLVEMTDNWPSQDVAAIDADLQARGLPTLTNMRVRFSKAIGRVMRRGCINDDVEYYAVRNAAELAGPDDGALWGLLAAYEQNAAR
jgi:hypothetical protein